MSARPLFLFPTGGGSSEVSWETVDLGDGSWETATDPDGIIDTATTSSGVTTWTYNAISVGSNDYAFPANTTNVKTWRRHKALSFGGTPLVGGDVFAVFFEIDCSSGYSSDGPTQIFIGLSTDPTSTVRGTANFFGMAEQHTLGDAAPDFIACAPTSNGSVLSNGSNVLARGVVMVVGNRVTDVTVKETSQTNTSARDPGVVIATSDDIYLVIGAGTRGSGTIAAADTAVAKVRWAVAKLGA